MCLPHSNLVPIICYVCVRKPTYPPFKWEKLSNILQDGACFYDFFFVFGKNKDIFLNSNKRALGSGGNCVYVSNWLAG